MGAISGGVVDRHNRIVGNCRRGVCYSGCITGELCLIVYLLCVEENKLVKVGLGNYIIELLLKYLKIRAV